MSLWNNKYMVGFGRKYDKPVFDNRGFTILELVIVLVLVAIIGFIVVMFTTLVSTRVAQSTIESQVLSQANAVDNAFEHWVGSFDENGTRYTFIPASEDEQNPYPAQMQATVGSGLSEKTYVFYFEDGYLWRSYPRNNSASTIVNRIALEDVITLDFAVMPLERSSEPVGGIINATVSFSQERAKKIISGEAMNIYRAVRSFDTQFVTGGVFIELTEADLSSGV
ncbi:MAG: prepilin-type N-terminal cleavage/methylation domain-containing protein [Eggerthellaceae bacterium]|nr:prepilin-type N-terminal cleavage/methylation domain-containing protein [Eggerthellaceae bacterium]